MTTVTLTREQIDQMLADKAGEYGYSLQDFHEMASNGSLAEPELRDLWIIWGDTPLSFEQA